jgi:Xaa-Pro aminopeptidase
MSNLNKIIQAVSASEVDGMMITSQANRLYATGFDATDAVVIVAAGKAWFFTDSRYDEAAGLAIKDAVVLQTNRENSYSSRINAVLDEYGIKTLGFEQETMTVSEFAVWKERLHAELIPQQSLMTNLRAVKSRDELACLIRAQRVAEKSFNEILPIISTDITEKELAAELMCRFYKNGADDKSFDPIVISGERTSMPHGVPTDNKIKKGFLTMDFGVKLNGWCSDTTRTVCVGQPDEQMRRVYDTVLRAQLAGIEKARAGLTGCEIDAAARDVINDAGYGGYFGHSFGHSVGLLIHESPNLSPLNNEPIPAGAVVSAEPGIYIPGKYGVRIEDVLYITEDGNENLTNLPKELIIL